MRTTGTRVMRRTIGFGLALGMASFANIANQVIEHVHSDQCIDTIGVIFSCNMSEILVIDIAFRNRITRLKGMNIQ